MKFGTLRSRLFSAMAVASILVACGGGGGSNVSPVGDGSSASASGGSTSGTSLAVATAGTLASTAPTPSYASSSSGQSAYEELNILRAGAGAGLLAQSTALDTSSQAHASYLIANLQAVGISHYEDASLGSFYAEAPADRMRKAGFDPNFLTEVIGGSGASNQGADCVRGLLDTAYHGMALLSEAKSVGFGFADDFTLLCVSDLASTASDVYGQVPPAGSIVAYPYAGQIDVLTTFYVSAESPRVSTTLLPNLVAGTPVIVRLRNADYVNAQATGRLVAGVSEFTLTDSAGQRVPSVLIGSTNVVRPGSLITVDDNLYDGFVELIPQLPLSHGATYTVHFTANIGATSSLIQRTWSFTTQ